LRTSSQNSSLRGPPGVAYNAPCIERAFWSPRMRCSLAVFFLLSCAFVVRAEDIKTDDKSTFQIPYRLTNTKHVLVRAKINDKGPFNFIIDTGAPTLFVGTKVCKKLGIEPAADGWGVFDKFEIEGGAIVSKARGRVADPFQLEGMNGLGLAGSELHGIIGYTILARFRLEVDFTRDKMTWTRLNFIPRTPMGFEGKGGGQGGLEAIGGIMKAVGGLFGKK